MVLLVLLGFWLVLNPGGRRVHPRQGANTVELRIGNTRGLLEASDAPGRQMQFRILTRDGFEGAAMSRAQAESLLGHGIVAEAADERANFLFRLFNITSWASLAWIALGFGAQALFSARMFLQWVISERHRTSIVTPAFWWFSLFGGILLFAYFVWRQDAVAVFGQSSGIVIYARNLRLIAKQRRREQREVARQVPVAG
jgi:lipid-A-disaccharide synthase-like uncharacterized protein